mmetsp:Transcript_23333/g.40579  ORF Transcript_23333/g.40579 Transcript_23333/m.40579 type:complete len:732 (-) Transcript_23333:1538-3733(-)
MQMAAGGPKEVLGPDKAAELIMGKEPQRDQFGGVLHLVNILANPEQRLQIAQAALGLFHIGFHHIALPLPFVAGVAFGQFRLDKGAFAALKEVGAQAVIQRGRQVRVAHQKPVFQHRRADGEILSTQPDAIAHRAAGVPHLQLEIPQDIKRRFDHILGPGGDLVGRQKQQIDVGERGHLAPAIAAHSDHGEALAGGGGRIGVQQGLGGAQGRHNQLIRQIGIGPRGGSRPERGGAKGVGNGGAPLFLGSPQVIHDQGTPLARIISQGSGQDCIKCALIKDVRPGADQFWQDRNRGRLFRFDHDMLLPWGADRRRALKAGATKSARCGADHDNLLVAHGGHGQPAFVGAVAQQAKDARRALKARCLGQSDTAQRVWIASAHQCAHCGNAIKGKACKRMRGTAISGLVLAAERRRAVRIGQRKPAALHARQFERLGWNIPTGQANILGGRRAHARFGQQLGQQGQTRRRRSRHKDGIGSTLADGRPDLRNGVHNALLGQRVLDRTCQRGPVAGDGALNRIAAQLAGNILRMNHHDTVTTLLGGVAHKTVGRRVKGRPKDKDVAARNGRIVGKGQHIHVACRHCNACSIRGLTIERPKNDLRAIIDGLRRLIGSGLGVASGAIDTQVNFDPVQVAHRQTGCIFKVLCQQVVTGRPTARHQKGHRHRGGRVNAGTGRSSQATKVSRITCGQSKGGHRNKQKASRLAQRFQKREHGYKYSQIGASPFWRAHLIWGG